jgi:transposase-like protein
MSDLSNPIFHDEAKAREWLEARLWPNGPICPHCGTVDQATLMKGASHRPGLYQCNACREPFTVTVGTLYERSKVPLHKWLAATHLMMASKKGMSALQIGRLLGLSKKTAWFLCHRIRESLRETEPGMLGGEGSTVEMDETFVGGLEKNKHRSKARVVLAKRRSMRSLSAKAAFAPITFPRSMPRTWPRSLKLNYTARPSFTRTKALHRRVLAASMRNMTPSITALANMCAATFTPTRLRVTFPS